MTKPSLKLLNGDAIPETPERPGPELKIGVAGGKVRLILSATDPQEFTAHFDFSPEEAGQFAHLLVQAGKRIQEADLSRPRLALPGDGKIRP